LAPATREQAPWDPKAGTYGLLTGRITDRLADSLLDAAGVARGMRVLDVGTGPGYAARRAAERGAVATGVDIADELLALARRSNRGIRFLHADAEALPFDSGSFDALVCNFAIGHVAQPDVASREFARVVVPGARIALSAWDSPEHNRLLGILVDAVQACGLGGPREPPPGPDLRGLMSGAGLADIDVEVVSLTHRVGDVDELWEGVLGGSVRTAGLVMRQPPATRDRIRGHFERLAEQHRDEDGRLAIPVRAEIASGRRP
jgi:SAM-dependent methyltransferase